MWHCECGEFNNDEASFCVACKRVRISEEKTEDIKKAVHATEGMFRKIQEFVLLDIAVLCIAAIISFLIYRFSELAVEGILIAYALIFVVVMLFQLFLLICILRMFYNAAINSERNTFFLQKIYQIVKKEDEEKEDEANSSL